MSKQHHVTLQKQQLLQEHQSADEESLKQRQCPQEDQTTQKQLLQEDQSAKKKRSREDEPANENPPEVDESSKKKRHKVGDALTFVTALRNRFRNDERVFKSFVDILTEYRMEQKSNKEVHQEVTSLLEGQADLVEEFGKFFPEITLPLKFDEAQQFIRKVKLRFPNGPELESFVKILVTSRKQQKSSQETYKEAQLLFLGHKDLMEDLGKILLGNSSSMAVPDQNKLTEGVQEDRYIPGIWDGDRPMEYKTFDIFGALYPKIR